MEADYGNPSSLHQKGLDAGHYIKETKEILAKEWKVDSKEIVLTSGGTESNNLALIGAALANKRSGNRIITSKVEHASVSSTMASKKRIRRRSFMWMRFRHLANITFTRNGWVSI